MRVRAGGTESVQGGGKLSRDLRRRAQASDRRFADTPVMIPCDVNGRHSSSGSHCLRPPPSRMKILWLSHFVLWPSTGHGALARSFHLVREAARRHELHLVALAPPAADGNHDEAALASARAALREYCASAELIPIERRAGRARRALLAARSWPSPHAYWEHWYWSQDGADAFTATQRRTEPALVHLDTIFLRRGPPARPRALRAQPPQRRVAPARATQPVGVGGGAALLREPGHQGASRRAVVGAACRVQHHGLADGRGAVATGGPPRHAPALSPTASTSTSSLSRRSSR